MRYLCLIHFDEQTLENLPAPELNALNAAHLDFNDRLRENGKFLLAEALEPPRTASCVRVRKGKPIVTDGPYAETKEMVAGFYVIEAQDMREALELASRIPAAEFATVEVRPARQLVIEGRERRWG